jgi:hypothetical protein
MEMNKEKIAALKNDLFKLVAHVAAIEAEAAADGEKQVLDEAGKVDNQKQDKELKNEAKKLMQEESKITSESIKNLSGVKVQKNLDYANQNTKMSSDQSIAAELVKLAKTLISEDEEEVEEKKEEKEAKK